MKRAVPLGVRRIYQRDHAFQFPDVFSYYFSLQKGLPVSSDCSSFSVHRKMLPIQQKTDIIDKEQYRVLLEEEFCETPEGERMIVCNNCGASYADDAPRCPYCGGDNFEKSVQVHEDTINDLKREKQQWEEKPQRVAKAGMSMAAKVLITVIVAGLLISAGIYVAMRIHTVASDNREQAVLEKLEKMYQQQDYSGICTYMKKHNTLYGEAFRKYRLVETLENDTKDYLITPEGEYLERIIREKKPTGLSDVSYIIDALIVCQKSEAADYKYEEQEAVAYYREYCSAYLNEHYELTEEEIKEVMDGYDPSDKDNQSNLERMMQERAFSHLTE